jgi:hypothetical protein
VKKKQWGNCIPCPKADHNTHPLWGRTFHIQQKGGPQGPANDYRYGYYLGFQADVVKLFPSASDSVWRMVPAAGLDDKNKTQKDVYFFENLYNPTGNTENPDYRYGKWLSWQDIWLRLTPKDEYAARAPWRVVPVAGKADEFYIQNMWGQYEIPQDRHFGKWITAGGEFMSPKNPVHWHEKPSFKFISTNKDSDYRGHQTTTRLGYTCKAWTWWDQIMYPNAGLEFNECRNPNGMATIWCRTTDPNRDWDFCDPCNNAKDCAGTKAAQIAKAVAKLPPDQAWTGPSIIALPPPLLSPLPDKPLQLYEVVRDKKGGCKSESANLGEMASPNSCAIAAAGHQSCTAGTFMFR